MKLTPYPYPFLSVLDIVDQWRHWEKLRGAMTMNDIESQARSAVIEKIMGSDF